MKRNAFREKKAHSYTLRKMVRRKKISPFKLEDNGETSLKY